MKRVDLSVIQNNPARVGCSGNCGSCGACNNRNMKGQMPLVERTATLNPAASIVRAENRNEATILTSNTIISEGGKETTTDQKNNTPPGSGTISTPVIDSFWLERLQSATTNGVRERLSAIELIGTSDAARRLETSNVLGTSPQTTLTQLARTPIEGAGILLVRTIALEPSIAAVANDTYREPRRTINGSGVFIQPIPPMQKKPDARSDRVEEYPGTFQIETRTRTGGSRSENLLEITQGTEIATIAGFEMTNRPKISEPKEFVASVAHSNRERVPKGSNTETMAQVAEEIPTLICIPEAEPKAHTPEHGCNPGDYTSTSQIFRTEDASEPNTQRIAEVVVERPRPIETIIEISQTYEPPGQRSPKSRRKNRSQPVRVEQEAHALHSQERNAKTEEPVGEIRRDRSENTRSRNKRITRTDEKEVPSIRENQGRRLKEEPGQNQRESGAKERRANLIGYEKWKLSELLKSPKKRVTLRHTKKAA
ncbi:hypothetical protein HY990_01215 [Candidatus Micrarchaeota archaeon]|nr:hypothetical protein [Candidatus Micrarchaeota archaeon]